MSRVPEMPGAVRAIARLTAVAAYSLGLLALNALHFEMPARIAITTVVVAIWFTMLIAAWIGLARSDDRRAYAWAHISVPLLLAAPILIVTPARWSLALLLIVCYILELRRTAAGHGFFFSLGLVAFIIILAPLGMAYFERDSAASPLTSIPAAAGWTFTTMFRLRSQAGEPLTDDGRTLSIVVGVCSIIAASLFTAQIVKWVIGRGTDHEEHAPSPEVAAELAALRATIDGLVEELRGKGVVSRPDPSTAEAEFERTDAPPTSS